MAIKISKVANDLNVGIPTLVEFLQKKGQEVGDASNLNMRISDEQYEMLVSLTATSMNITPALSEIEMATTMFTLQPT